MRPSRRDVLRTTLLSGGAFAMPASARLIFAAGVSENVLEPVQLQIGDRLQSKVREDFLGLGYEISSVARSGLLSPGNRHYVSLVRTLGPRGVIRVGGNTSDDAAYGARLSPRSVPVGSVVNRANLEELGGFLRATGWRLLWGLNLGTGSREHAVREAAAVAAAVGDGLLGFEIGNEPDLFARNPKHRPSTYGYDDYLREWRAWRAAVRARLPDARFAGPDAADRTDWVERFARDEGRGLLLLTHHYYRECENPGSTIDKLLGSDPKLGPELNRLQEASHAAGVPYRICEMNSFCGGGRPGVSNTFAGALWALDILCRMAAHGCAGVNLQTGVNQRGFISSYSPIGDDDQGHVSAAPEFYGLLAFRQAQAPAMYEVTWDVGADRNVSAWAFGSGSAASHVVLINKEPQSGLAARLPRQPRDVIRLRAPALNATSGVTLGGKAVAADGTWSPERQPPEGVQNTVVVVPAASAAICVL